ncbi:MAG: hypothetical protein ACYC1M_00915 [Armatimonadota bacterium]
MKSYPVISSADGRYIDGLPVLRWGNWQDCTYGGAVKLVMDALGVNVSYEQIMGYSGACYRMAMAENWDPSSGMPQIGRDVETALNNAIGFAPYCIADAALRDLHVVKCVDAGVPVLCCGPRGEPEWGVITGYGDNGRYFYGRTYFDDEGAKASDIYTDNRYFVADLYPGQCPDALLRFYDRTCMPVSALEALRASLIACIELFEQVPNNYLFGYDAYAVLITGFELDDDQYDEFGNNGEHHLGTLFDARRSASIYLKQSAMLLEEPNRSRTLQVADLYASIIRVLQAVVPYEDTSSAFGGQETRSWDRPLRMQIAGALRNVVQIEKELRLVVKKILSEWEDGHDS